MPAAGSFQASPMGAPPPAPSDCFPHERILLVRRPRGLPSPADFRLERLLPLSPQDLVPPPGGLLVRNAYVSIDPAMRGWMSEARSYLPPVGLGEVMRAATVGTVLASDVAGERFPPGCWVRCDGGGVQTHSALGAEEVRAGAVRRLDPAPTPALPARAHLGVLGLTGLTAYFGMLRVGRPRPGDTVLVSGAAGATGSAACQIARIVGCRVVGTAGTEAKCRWLVEEGICDEAVCYRRPKGEGSLSRAIRDACGRVGRRGGRGGGADVVFDNVGGEFLEAAMSNLARGARVVLCGAISQYNADSSAVGAGVRGGPRNYMNLLVRRATMEGFVVFDYRNEYGKALAELGRWVQEGMLCHREHVVDGIENFPAALTSLFDGTNQGKCVLRVAGDDGDDGDGRRSGMAKIPPSRL